MKEYVKLKVDTYTDLVRENVALEKRNTDLIIECHEKDEIIETQKKVNNNLARTQRIMWDFLEEIKMRKECENYVKVAEEGEDYE